mmetsp:Transcript_34989/g.54682  ORF Transcript_34989/g.54682 Transcript_34989/m.54682 type:complete len:256 (-) Transcript_34989:365-1132(-)
MISFHPSTNTNPEIINVRCVEEFALLACAQGSSGRIFSSYCCLNFAPRSSEMNVIAVSPDGHCPSSYKQDSVKTSSNISPIAFAFSNSCSGLSHSLHVLVWLRLYCMSNFWNILSPIDASSALYSTLSCTRVSAHSLKPSWYDFSFDASHMPTSCRILFILFRAFPIHVEWLDLIDSHIADSARSRINTRSFDKDFLRNSSQASRTCPCSCFFTELLSLCKCCFSNTEAPSGSSSFCFHGAPSGISSSISRLKVS